MKNLLDDQPIKLIEEPAPNNAPDSTPEKKTNNGTLIVVIILAICVIGFMMYLNYKKNENAN